MYLPILLHLQLFNCIIHYFQFIHKLDIHLKLIWVIKAEQLDTLDNLVIIKHAKFIVEILTNLLLHA